MYGQTPLAPRPSASITSWTLRIAAERRTIPQRRRRFSSPRLDLELLQRLVDRRGRQVRVEVAALAVVDGAVGEDQQLGAVADLLHRFLLDPLDRAAGRLRLQQRDVDRGGAAAELLPEVLEQVGVVLAGDLAVGLVGERRQAVVAAEDDREGGFDRAGVLAGVVERGPAAEHGAGREVLDLALAVDRRVGDDGDRLLEVVGEVLALGRERRQRPVVAERADRLGPVGGHLLDEFDVVALPAEAGEDAVGDLDRLLGAGVGVAGDVVALERAAGLERAVVAGDLVDAVALAASGRGRSAASRRAGAGSSGAAARSISTSAFSPGASGFGSETIVVDGDDARARS